MHWEGKLKYTCMYMYVQLKLSYATFQWNVEIGSHKAGDRLIQVRVTLYNKCSVKGNYYIC